MKRIPLFIILVFLCFTVNAQSWKDTVRAIDLMFSRYLPNNPGGQLSISRNGKIIYSKAWGLADIENNIPYTTETVTEAGSISKQFTAAAILLLEQQGKLSLNDDVRKYIPELPEYGLIITIGNLLHHTSGLREWSSLVAITGWPRTTKAYRNVDVLSLICRQSKINNIPGNEFIYSNSNYVLLAIIIERISGKTLAGFTNDYIFKPAGMTHTNWRNNYKKIVLKRGIAYSKKGNYYEINMPNESVYGPGGLLTTTEDLLKWNDFYLSGKLGTRSLLNRQLTIEPLKGGAETNYAAGLFIDKFNGMTRIYHDGQTASYTGILECFPAKNFSIAWLSNTTEFKDGLFEGVESVENLFFKDTTKVIDQQTPNSPPMSGKASGKYIGWYCYSKTNQGIKISLKNDTLFFDKTPLTPLNKAAFRYKSSMVDFENKNGFLLITADKRQLFFSKKVGAERTTNYLKSFTGKYYSKETESNFTITLRGGKLFLEKGYLKDIELISTYRNAFNFYISVDSELNPQLANVVFKRKGDGIVQCQVSTSDAIGINFTKIHQ